MDKMKMESVDLNKKNIEKIEELFPNCITETIGEDGKLKKAINFEQLRQMLSDEVIEGDEAYEFTWVGKKASIVEANKPIRKTLRPCKEESLDWDNTENLYIEGDNLEVLKLLQESYLGKVKMIYIDPPYNTGSDFIYNDDFKMSRDEYSEESGEFDEYGDRLFKNSDTNGRFHSDWCSMIYPRLMLARNLLSDDGVIFISMDENEHTNLKKICDEVFGEKNYVENFVWIKNSTKNLSRTTSTNHEYILCYCKDISVLSDKSIFRAEKKGLRDVNRILEKANKENWPEQETEERLKAYYKENPELKGIKMYNRVEKRIDEKTGQLKLKVYRLDNISAPKSTGKAQTYDLIHPKTGLPCEISIRGWAYTKKTMDEHLKNGLIYFYEDHTKVPAFKRFLDTVTTEVKKSVITDFNDGKKDLQKLFGEAYFDNAKPVSLIYELLGISSKDSIILDFFSGSSTSAHAVMQLNADDGGNRKYIMVQIPEKTDEKSAAYKAGYKNICEIGKERIRRAGKKILEENQDKEGIEKLDTGFRVLKLDDTNMKDVYYNPLEYSQELLTQLESNIKEDRNDLDLLFGCLLEWGLPLSMPYSSEVIEGCTVHDYNDGDLIACFNEDIPDRVIKEIAKRQPLRAVFRDSSFEDSPSKINVSEIFKLMAPDTRIKVI